MQDEFDSLRSLCFPTSNIFLLCFCVVRPTSFKSIADRWLPKIRRCAPGVPTLLVGTQCDLRHDALVLIDLARRGQRPVTEQQARMFARSIGATQYVECSALTQYNL